MANTKPALKKLKFEINLTADNMAFALLANHNFRNRESLVSDFIKIIKNLSEGDILDMVEESIKDYGVYKTEAYALEYDLGSYTVDEVKKAEAVIANKLGLEI